MKKIYVLVILYLIKLIYAASDNFAQCQIRIVDQKEWCIVLNVKVETRQDSISRTIQGGNNNNGVTRVKVDQNETMRYVLRDIFVKFTKLDVVIMSNVNLNEIDNSSLFNCPLLEYLDLSRNGLQKITNATFEMCKNLTYIDLSYNRLNNTDLSAFKVLYNLQSLNLEGNFLSNEILSQKFEGTCLKNLSLVKNQISGLHEDLIRNLDLKSLSLSDNRMFHIPRNFFIRAQNLLRLELDRNQLSLIDGFYFSNLINLEYLNLEHNQIPYVSCKLFQNLSNLQELKLAGNSIIVVCDEAFKSLKKLQYLEISYNRFSSIISNPRVPLKNLTSIEVLDMSHNAIHFLEKGFGLSENYNIKKLYLNNNKIYYIHPQMFKNLKNLMELDLSYNHLITLSSETFGMNKNLKYLYISNNNFTRIEYKLLAEIKQINMLDFSYNSIIEINQSLNTIFKNYQVVNFTGNQCINDVLLKNVSQSEILSCCFENYENRDKRDIEMPSIPTYDPPQNITSKGCENFGFSKYFVAAFLIVLINEVKFH